MELNELLTWLLPWIREQGKKYKKELFVTVSQLRHDGIYLKYNQIILYFCVSLSLVALVLQSKVFLTYYQLKNYKSFFEIEHNMEMCLLPFRRDFCIG